jgi:hypothetical protein
MPQQCRKLAVVAMFAIVLTALFPMAGGPFTASHGPVTALRATAFAVLLFAAIACLPCMLLVSCESYQCTDISLPGIAGNDRLILSPLRC